ncbi:ATP-dependent Clp protease adaptor protein ClpS [hydrothermal vent metagenome]|uniref:ATP-dependent Clp protease adaptor protein ClpS n=1 Tax=hydrothermal vent metagenome TaxID=652676 RepID=A0A3B0RJ72_9ZZZZ
MIEDVFHNPARNQERDKRPPGEIDGPQTGVVEKTKTRNTYPNQYKVLLLNDDYTPMEFVVHLLCEVFHRTEEEAVQIMLKVHQDGVGICGVYSYEVAETKVALVVAAARSSEHPLQCTMEKA